MNNKQLIIAATAAVLLTGIIAGGITYGVLSARFSRENNILAQRLAVLEKSRDKKPTAAEIAPSVTQDAAQAEIAKYGDWLTYTNSETGYTLRYPTDWTFEESSDEIDGQPVKNVTFISPENGYYVTFGLRPKGSDALLSARKGMGAGTIKENGTLTVMGIAVKKSDLVYKNKTKVVFYPGAGGTFETQGFEGLAEFSIIDSGNYEAFDIAGVPEALLADKIISSLKITK